MLFPANPAIAPSASNHSIGFPISISFMDGRRITDFHMNDEDSSAGDDDCGYRMGPDQGFHSRHSFRSGKYNATRVSMGCIMLAIRA